MTRWSGWGGPAGAWTPIADSEDEMMAGLPWTAWALIAAAVVPPLALATAFYRVHRDD